MHRRYAVGKTVAAGTLRVRRADFDFFPVPPPGERRRLLLHLEEGTRVEALLVRSGSHPGQVRLTFTGEEGLPLRRLIKKRLSPRRGKRPWGALLFVRRADGNLDVEVETPRQAEVEALRLERPHFLAGARPLYLLNPACTSLEEVVRRVTFTRSLPRLSGALDQELERAGWQRAGSSLPGLDAGRWQAATCLQLVTEAGLLAPALLGLGTAQEGRRCELGVLLAWGETVAGRLGRESSQGPLPAGRLLRLLEQFPYLVRGPLAIVELGTKRRLR